MGLGNSLWLLLLVSLWGTSFLFIKVAVGEIPPLTLVVGRVGMATLLLYIVLRMQGKNLPKFGPILTGIFLGFVSLVLLIAPSLLGRVHATTWGLIAVTMAAACYGAPSFIRVNIWGACHRW